MAALGTDVDARSDAGASPEPVADEPVGGDRAWVWLRRNWEVVALGLAAVVVALVVQRFVYPAFSWNRDEVTYLWQVDGLSAGRVLLPDGGAPQFFWPWLAGHTGSFFFAQYTVGWPIVILAVETVFGSPLLSLPFGTALAVCGAYAFAHELTKDRSLSLLTGVLMLASPFVVIQSGTYLGYLFSLGLGLFFGTALLAGLRRDSNALLFVAGVLLGWLFLTRPLDAILWAAPFGLYAVIVHWRRWHLLVGGAVVVAAGFVPFLVVTLLYNRHVSGNPLEFPLTAKDPLDTFGFGLRRLMPGAETFSYTGRVAIDSTIDNFRELPRFLFGGLVGVAAAAVGLWLRRRDRSTVALVFLALAFPLGYFVFWGNLLSTKYSYLTSPVYYVPLYFPLCVLIATTLLAAWRNLRVTAVVLCALLVLVTLPSLVDQIHVNHRISVAQEPWRDSTNGLRGHSLVFVADAGDYLLHLNPYSRNTPDLDGRILYAVSRDEANIELIESRSDRVPYLQVTTDPRWDNPIDYNDAGPPEVSLVPIGVLHGRTADLNVTVTNPRDEPVVVAYLELGGNVVDKRVLSTDAHRGDRFETTWRIGVPSAAADDQGVVPVSNAGKMRVGYGTGRSEPRALAGPIARQQLPYRVANDQIDLLYAPVTYVRHAARPQRQYRPVVGTAGIDVQITTNR
jgi:hypothetical protein